MAAAPSDRWGAPVDGKGEEAAHVALVCGDGCAWTRSERASWVLRNLYAPVVVETANLEDDAVRARDAAVFRLRGSGRTVSVPDGARAFADMDEAPGDVPPSPGITPLQPLPAVAPLSPGGIGMARPILAVPDTRVTFVARRNRIVFVLDLSPSAVCVHAGTGRVVLDDMAPALTACLRCLSAPLSQPRGCGAPPLIETTVSVVAHDRSSPVRTLVHGATLAPDTVDAITATVQRQLWVCETASVGVPDGTHAADGGLVGLAQAGLFVLGALPEDAAGSVVVLSDCVLGSPDPLAPLDGVLSMFWRREAACSFVQLGPGSAGAATAALGYVPNSDIACMLARATGGAFLSAAECVAAVSTTSPAADESAGAAGDGGDGSAALAARANGTHAPDDSAKQDAAVGPTPSIREAPCGSLAADCGMNPLQFALLTRDGSASWMWPCVGDNDLCRWSGGRVLLGATEAASVSREMLVASAATMNSAVAVSGCVATGASALPVPVMRRRIRQFPLVSPLGVAVEARVRDGFRLERIHATEEGVAVHLAFPWQQHARIEVVVRGQWPVADGRGWSLTPGALTGAEVSVVGTYGLLRLLKAAKDAGGGAADAARPMGAPSEHVAALLAFVAAVQEADHVNAHFASFLANPACHAVPVAVRTGGMYRQSQAPEVAGPRGLSGLPMLVPGRSDGAPEAAFGAFWSVVASLPLSVWHLHLCVGRISSLAPADGATEEPEFIPRPQRATAAVASHLRQWCAFPLVGGQSFVRFLARAGGNGARPDGFCVARLAWDAAAVLSVRLGFYGATPALRRDCTADLVGALSATVEAMPVAIVSTKPLRDLLVHPAASSGSFAPADHPRAGLMPVLRAFLSRRSVAWPLAAATARDAARALVARRKRERFVPIAHEPVGELTFVAEESFEAEGRRASQPTLVQFCCIPAGASLSSHLWIEPQHGAVTWDGNRLGHAEWLAAIHEGDHRVVSALHTCDAILALVRNERAEADEAAAVVGIATVEVSRPDFDPSLLLGGATHVALRQPLFAPPALPMVEEGGRERDALARADEGTNGILLRLAQKSLAALADAEVQLGDSSLRAMHEIVLGAPLPAGDARWCRCFVKGLSASSFVLAVLPLHVARTDRYGESAPTSPNIASRGEGGGMFGSDVQADGAFEGSADEMVVHLFECDRAECLAGDLGTAELDDEAIEDVPGLVSAGALTRDSGRFWSSVRNALGRNYVVGVYRSLQCGLAVSIGDFMAAMESCEEAYVEIDVTAFLQALSRAEPVGDGDAAGGESLRRSISRRFAAILSRHFQPVPGNDEYFYLTQPNAPGGGATVAAAAAVPGPSTDDALLASSDGEFLADSEDEHGHARRADAARQAAEVAEIAEEGEAASPLFVRLECTVRHRRQEGGSYYNNVSVSTLPTSLRELLQEEGAEEMPPGDGARGSLDVTLRLVCLTMSPLGADDDDEFAALPERPPADMERTEGGQQRAAGLAVVKAAEAALSSEEDASGSDGWEEGPGGEDSDHADSDDDSHASSSAGSALRRTGESYASNESIAGSSDGAASSYGGDSEGAGHTLDPLDGLDADHRTIVESVCADVRWLLEDETVSALRHERPVTEATIERVTAHVGSLARPLPTSSTSFSIPLKFVNEEQSRPLFEAEFRSLSVDGLVLLAIGDAFVAVRPDSAGAAGDRGDATWALPFWMVLRAERNRVQVHFHSREEGAAETAEHGALLRLLRDAVRAASERVNRILLLRELHETRVCSALLLPPPEEEIWAREEDGAGDGGEVYLSSHGIARVLFRDGQFECPCVFRTHFPLHWRLRSTQALRAIAGTLGPFSVTNRPSLFVYREKGGAVFYLKVLESLCSTAEPSDGAPSPAVHASDDGTFDDDSSLNLSVAPPLGRNASSSQLSLSDGARARSLRRQVKESVVLEVYGVDPAGPEITRDLVEMLEAKIAGATLTIISTNMARNVTLRLTAEDHEFLRRPDEAPARQAVVDVPACASPLTFFVYLRQNLLQFTTPLLLADAPAHPDDDGSGTADTPGEAGACELARGDYAFLYNCLVASSAAAPIGQGMACVFVAPVRRGKVCWRVPFGNPATADDATALSAADHEFAFRVSVFVRGSVSADALVERVVLASTHAKSEMAVEGRLLSTSLLGPAYSTGVDSLNPVVAAALPLLDSVCDTEAPSAGRAEHVLGAPLPRWALPAVVAELVDVVSDCAPLLAPMLFRECGAAYVASTAHASHLDGLDCGPPTHSSRPTYVILASSSGMWLDGAGAGPGGLPHDEGDRLSLFSATESAAGVPGGPEHARHVMHEDAAVTVDGMGSVVVPRRCLVSVTVLRDRIVARSYNLMPQVREALDASIARILSWHAHRSSLLGTVLLQKMGLGHHAGHLLHASRPSHPAVRSLGVVEEGADGDRSVLGVDALEALLNAPVPPRVRPSAPGAPRDAPAVASPATKGGASMAAGPSPHFNRWTSTLTRRQSLTLGSPQGKPALAQSATVHGGLAQVVAQQAQGRRGGQRDKDARRRREMDQALFESLLREALPPHVYAASGAGLYDSSDPVRRQGEQLQRIASHAARAADRLAALRSVHMRWSGGARDARDRDRATRGVGGANDRDERARGPPVSMGVVKRSSRLVHYCRRPLLFLAPTRRGERDARDDAAMEEAFAVRITGAFVQQYLAYLESLGFSVVPVAPADHLGLSGGAQSVRAGESQASAARGAKRYAQQCFGGGVVLVEVCFRERYACVNLHAFDTAAAHGGLLGEPARRFARECARFKDLLHINSFAYDFHLRQLESFLAEPSLAFPRTDLRGLLDEFFAEFPVTATFARNRLRRGGVAFEWDGPTPPAGSGAAIEAFVAYMINRASHYGFISLRHRAVPGAVFVTSRRPDFAPRASVPSVATSEGGHGYCLVAFAQDDGQGDARGAVSRPQTLTLQYYVIVIDKRNLYPIPALHSEAHVAAPAPPLDDLVRNAEGRLAAMVQEAKVHYHREHLWGKLLAGAPGLGNAGVTAAEFEALMRLVHRWPVQDMDPSLGALYALGAIKWDAVLQFVAEHHADTAREVAGESGERHVVVFNPNFGDMLVHLRHSRHNVARIDAVRRELHQSNAPAEDPHGAVEREHVGAIVNTLCAALWEMLAGPVGL